MITPQSHIATLSSHSTGGGSQKKKIHRFQGDGTETLPLNMGMAQV